ncbi:hypothetical protein VTJ04DRAFT_9778 [Mycothermus thermophilus]|uniref:uncharacterized protein n=1 Tax=Humicola insolens TaxID=85995 RepID=UPI003744AA8B
MAETTTNSPIPLKRLEQIANDVCNSVMEGVEYYEHPKTAQWNETIVNKLLKAIIAEATPSGATAPSYKFAINSTIVQHFVPTSSSSSTSVSAEEGTSKKGHGGKRGMHSATGGYWNEKTDGMWSFKWDGEGKGLDVVIMLIWIGI